MRTRLAFLYADSKFDMQQCKYVWESSIVANTKIICGYNFVAPLKKLQFPTTCLNINLKKWTQLFLVSSSWCYLFDVDVTGSWLFWVQSKSFPFWVIICFEYFRAKYFIRITSFIWPYLLCCIRTLEFEFMCQICSCMFEKFGCMKHTVCMHK